MRTILAVAVAAAITVTPAIAQDAKPQLTVEQCLTILSGLKALDCAGQQLGGSCASDARQYKLGDARITIGENVQAITPVLTAYQRAQQQYMMELPPIPAAEPGKPTPPEVAQMQTDQNKKVIATQIAMLARPCNVTPGRLKWSDLKIGDDADHNAIPPSVLGAIGAMMDK